jgi:hypothetical protein
MQLQKTTNKAKIVNVKPLKKGTKVQWSSQAGGMRTTKTGTIVCVLKKDTNYYGGNSFPQNFMIPFFRERHNDTIAEAQVQFAEGNVWKNEWAMQSVYRMKFDLRGEMYRNTVHYLVAVEQGHGQKPHLYHPANYTALKVVK